MAKPARFQPSETSKGWCLNVPAKFNASGKRERLFYKKKKDALAKAAELRARTETYGSTAATIRPSLAEDATTAAEILCPWGITLTEAARIVADMREAEAASYPLGEAAEAWLESCSDLRARTLQGYRHTKARLVDTLGADTMMAALTADELASAIMPVGTPTTAARGYLRTAKAFWRWAAKKGWCNAATIDVIEAPKARSDGEIEFLTVAEAETLLRVAEKHFPEAIASYALAMFAGIRAEEITRLTAADVSPEEIELGRHVTKKGRRRHITPNPTLAAWLTRYPFKPCQDWKRIDSACRYLASWKVRPLGGVTMNKEESAEEFEARPQ